MITRFRYGIFRRDGGYRILAMSPETGKWEDCQTLFGERDASLWITYPTEAAAKAAIAPRIEYEGLPRLAPYRAIYNALAYWAEPGATLPAPETWHHIKEKWARLKPNLIDKYHPIIDDRLAEVASRLSRQPEPEPRQKTGHLCPTDGWVSSGWPD